MGGKTHIYRVLIRERWKKDAVWKIWKDSTDMDIKEVGWESVD